MESAAYIDLDAIEHNVAAIKEHVGVEVMAVVKANAYGHAGNVQDLADIVRAAQEGGATYVGVAHLDEAIALREAGCELPILAWLHAWDSHFEEAAELGIEIGVSSLEELEWCASLKTPPVIHLKVDTGLTRNGALPSDWHDIFAGAADYQNQGKVKVKGLFSHLSCADEPERPETPQQIEAFEEAIKLAEECGLEFELKHLANTAGSLAFPDARYDMARIGLGCYGLNPFTDGSELPVDLKPAMTLLAQLSKIKTVPAGSGVSYGQNYVTDKETSLGLVPLGYADGIPRTARGVKVAYKSKLYPVVGTIAMDQCVIDFGEVVEDTALGEVIVFGSTEGLMEGRVRLAPTADDLAEAAGTINYEIVTRIGPRVPRHLARRAPVVEGDVQSMSVPVTSVEETQEWAEAIGKTLKAGDVLILTGDLGAGKTTFTQGLARGLGVREGVISPTFVISRRHPSLSEGPHLVHIDAYRLNSAEELYDLDLESELEDSVIVAEWGEGFVEELNPEYLTVRIVRSSQDGEEDRTLSFEGPSQRLEQIYNARYGSSSGVKP